MIGQALTCLCVACVSGPPGPGSGGSSAAGGVTHSGDDEVAYLMQAGGGAVTMATNRIEKQWLKGH